MRQLVFPHGLKQMQELLLQGAVPGQVLRCGNGAKAEVIKGNHVQELRDKFRNFQRQRLGLQYLFIPHTHEENLRSSPRL